MSQNTWNIYIICCKLYKSSLDELECLSPLCPAHIMFREISEKSYIKEKFLRKKYLLMHRRVWYNSKVIIIRYIYKNFMLFWGGSIPQMLILNSERKVEFPRFPPDVRTAGVHATTLDPELRNKWKYYKYYSEINVLHWYLSWGFLQY